MLLASTITHAQQGNLPTPVQKLPAYPPVVCTTPNWTPEPCESRQVADEGGRWEWQCGNVNVKVTLSEKKVTLLEKPFNLPASTEYVITGIEKSNNRFQYVWGKDDLYLNGRLCVLKAKPLPKKDETKPEPPTAEPVKCLMPDGTEEPCESRHTAQNQDRPPSIPQESCRQIDNCVPVEPADNWVKSFLEVVKLFDNSWLGSALHALDHPVKLFDGRWPTVVYNDYGGVMYEHAAHLAIDWKTEYSGPDCRHMWIGMHVRCCVRSEGAALLWQRCFAPFPSGTEQRDWPGHTGKHRMDDQSISRRYS
jgi:hypothetical protein